MTCTCPKPSTALGFVPFVSKCDPCKALDIEQHAERVTHANSRRLLREALDEFERENGRTANSEHWSAKARKEFGL